MIPKQREDESLGESQKRVISALAQSNPPLQVQKKPMTGINTATEAKAA
jgi:hypothetical protein